MHKPKQQRSWATAPSSAAAGRCSRICPYTLGVGCPPDLVSTSISRSYCVLVLTDLSLHFGRRPQFGVVSVLLRVAPIICAARLLARVRRLCSPRAGPFVSTYAL